MKNLISLLICIFILSSCYKETHLTFSQDEVILITKNAIYDSICEKWYQLNVKYNDSITLRHNDTLKKYFRIENLNFPYKRKTKSETLIKHLSYLLLYKNKNNYIGCYTPYYIYKNRTRSYYNGRSLYDMCYLFLFFDNNFYFMGNDTLRNDSLYHIFLNKTENDSLLINNKHYIQKGYFYTDKDGRPKLFK